MTSTATTGTPKTAYDQLTSRQRRFVDLIIHGKKRDVAIREVGYKGERPADAAYKMLQRPLIRAAVQERDSMWMEAVDIGKAMIANEIGRIAFFDPRRMFDEFGALKPMHELDDDTAAAIQSVETHEELEEPPEDHDVNEPPTVTGRTRKVKVADKLGALRELASIYGMKDEAAAAGGATVGPGLTVIVQAAVTQVVQAPVAVAAPLEHEPLEPDAYRQFGLPPPGRAP